MCFPVSDDYLMCCCSELGPNLPGVSTTSWLPFAQCLLVLQPHQITYRHKASGRHFHFFSFSPPPCIIVTPALLLYNAISHEIFTILSLSRSQQHSTMLSDFLVARLMLPDYLNDIAMFYGSKDDMDFPSCSSFLTAVQRFVLIGTMC